MLIRSIDHDERLFATECLPRFSNLSEEVVKKTFEQQQFAKPKEGITESDAIVKRANKLSFNFDNCTFDEEPYKGIFFALSQDEKYEIRLKTIDALKHFSLHCPFIQEQAQDILMNMLSDEIDEVRIASLKNMAEFKNTLVLDKNSVNIVIFNLKEFNPALRHSIYFFFSHIKVDNRESFEFLIKHLIFNMAKFKQDRYSIFKTFQRLGNNHSHFIADNLDKILGHKLEYRFAEPNWINDDVHIAKMIMI